MSLQGGLVVRANTGTHCVAVSVACESTSLRARMLLARESGPSTQHIHDHNGTEDGA